MTSEELATLGRTADALLKHAHNMTTLREKLVQEAFVLQQRQQMLAEEAQKALTAAAVLDEVIRGMHASLAHHAQPEVSP